MKIFHAIKLSDVVFILFVNVKMPTIFDLISAHGAINPHQVLNGVQGTKNSLVRS